ncbi:MAG: hypothetical protein ACYC3Q_12825 [Gemmatimonadaceae bacterium]
MNKKNNAASLQRLVLAFTTGLLLALGARVSWSSTTTPVSTSSFFAP